MYENKIGVKFPEILLPRAGVEMEKWAAVACDQYTSEPEYWQKAEELVGNAPSTLRLMLPEMYLEKPDEAKRIEDINSTMLAYEQDGIFNNIGTGAVLVRRKVDGKTRNGLVLSLDLEEYDFTKGSQTLIRASEGTIVERIPPRMRIRANATLELPHILVLIDDPKKTVIEPLIASNSSLEKVYDFDLMLGGGHIEGWKVSDEKHLNAIINSLEKLANADDFEKKYGEGKQPMLFAMGDGNHSFATAKACWEKIKPTLTEDERKNHPARYALVELENIHDDGIVFEPIHRVLFGVEFDVIMNAITQKLADQNGGCHTEYYISKSKRDNAMLRARFCSEDDHIIPFTTRMGYGFYRVSKPTVQLEVGTLQNALDAVLAEKPEVVIDYIHGADVLERLSTEPRNIGFELAPMKKSDFFPTVIFDGALPRKTFSMGEAHEKRFYLECRKIK